MNSSDPKPIDKAVGLIVGGVQMTSGRSVAGNLVQAADGIAEAAARGAQLVVLPENFATLGTGEAADIASQEAVEGSMANWVMDQAKAHGITLVAGTVPVRQDSGKSRARCLVVGPDGQATAQYDKIHLFDADVGDAQGRYIESDHYEAGTDVVTFKVLDRLGQSLTVGLTVCYDLRFPELFYAFRKAVADLVLVPSAFTHRTGQVHWELLLRARAVEQGMYVLGVNQCGWHDSKRRTWGHSQLIDPWGETIAALASEPDVLVGQVELQRVQRIRRIMPTFEHHRMDA
ncbi:MAG: carbon-nitrogen hydrolase family protein [Natronospirillum sp.]